jgi:Domain of unknown function DUF29
LASVRYDHNSPVDGTIIAESYADSLTDAATETDLPRNTFAIACPFALDDCLNSAFLP